MLDLTRPYLADVLKRRAKLPEIHTEIVERILAALISLHNECEKKDSRANKTRD